MPHTYCYHPKGTSLKENNSRKADNSRGIIVEIKLAGITAVCLRMGLQVCAIPIHLPSISYSM